MADKLVIGLSGFARCGKDTLASILVDQYQYKENYKVKTFSFAKLLKRDIEDFLSSKGFKVDLFTNDNHLKELLRPIMIGYGSLARYMSGGTYWFSKVKKEIDEFFKEGGNIAIITDLRFKETKYDELDFIREYNSYVISIERDGNKPAHITEEVNIPVIRESADYILKWPTLPGFKECSEYAEPIIKDINDRLKRNA